MKKITTKDDVHRLFSAATASAAFGAAIETGLLWMLAEKPLSASEIVQSLSIPGKRGYYWLQYLEGIGILENNPNGYSPSSVVREAVLATHSQESWKHLVFDERERTAGVHNLAEYLGEPGSMTTAQGLPPPKYYVDEMRTSLARAREFTCTLFEVHQPLARTIAGLVDLTNARRLVDIGGGSGVVSIALLREYPGLTSTVIDIENVCIAGCEIAAREGLSDRISYHPTEFDLDPFPVGFDAAIHCDLGVYELALFQKVYKSLLPGGRLIIVGHFSPSEVSAPLTRVEWTFLDSLHDPDYGIPTLEQVKEQLAVAGFTVSPEHHELDRGWIVLQASKRQAF